jgi:hypothetical protein
MAEHEGIEYRLTSGDPRYPILVLNGEFGVVGYSLNRDTGDLERVCVCAAWSKNECICGAWDEEN